MVEITPFTLGINLKSYRISVGIRIIEKFQYPKRIRLLMHPEKMQVVIQPCDLDELCSFRVSKKRVIETRHGPEYNSAMLVRIIRERIALNDGESYRFYGKYDPDNNLVLFDLNNYCVLDATSDEESD